MLLRKLVSKQIAFVGSRVVLLLLSMLVVVLSALAVTSRDSKNSAKIKKKVLNAAFELCCHSEGTEKSSACHLKTSFSTPI